MSNKLKIYVLLGFERNFSKHKVFEPIKIVYHEVRNKRKKSSKMCVKIYVKSGKIILNLVVNFTILGILVIFYRKYIFDIKN